MKFINKTFGVILCGITLFGSFRHLQAQDSKKVNVKFEEVKAKCEGLPLEKRVRMAVVRFNVTTPSATTELGDNMATMLTSALGELNCFRMLEMVKNQNDLDIELQHGNSQSKDRKARAQVVVNGEVTEFTKQKKSGGTLMVQSSKEIVRLGFIIKLVNPETRDILFQKSINVEGKASGGTSAIIGRKWLGGGVNLGSGENKNEAVANALEQGIIEAAEFIGDKKEQLELPEAGGVSSTSTTISELTVQNTDYDRMSGLETKLKGLGRVKSVESNLNDTQAVLTVEHTGTTKELLDELKAGSGGSFKIVGLNAGAAKATISMN